MEIHEFSDGLKQIITLGEERVDVEYKGKMAWGIGCTNRELLRAMMAMANTRDGGTIVIGVLDSTFDPVGLDRNEFDSYDYDTIAKWVNNYTQPVIDFTLRKGKLTDDSGVEKLFVMIGVEEADDFPIVSTQLILKNPSVSAYLGNIEIREGAVYIRSKSPVESREIAGHREWKDFVNLLLDRNQDRLIKMIPWSGISEAHPAEESDADKFNKQLGEL